MSMDDLDIDIFLSETNALDASLFMEPSLSALLEATMADLMESPTAGAPIESSNHIDPYPSSNNQMPAFMPTPSLPSPSNAINPVISVDNLDSSPMDPFAAMDQPPACNASQNLPINEQPPQAFVSQTFPMNPEELPPQAFVSQSFPMNPQKPAAYFQSLIMSPEEQLSSSYFFTESLPMTPEEQFPQAYFPNQNLPIYFQEQLLPAYFSSQNLPMNTVEQPPPPYFATQNLPMNTVEQAPPPYFVRQNIPVNTEEQPYQLPCEYPLSKYYGLETQLPGVEYQPLFEHSPKQSSNFANSVGIIMNHDPEAVTSFLAGLVRPGPDVTRIYKCSVCCLEFPNAQAFGGHMSSHSKNKRVNPVAAEGGKAKNAKRTRTKTSSSSSSDSKKEKKAKTSKGKKSKKKKRVVEKKPVEDEGVQEEHGGEVMQEKMRWESDESVNSEFIIGEETGFEIE